MPKMPEKKTAQKSVANKKNKKLGSVLEIQQLYQQRENY